MLPEPPPGSQEAEDHEAPMIDPTTRALRAVKAQALREEAERLEPYWTIDQKNRRHEHHRFVHSTRTREVLYDRADEIESAS